MKKTEIPNFPERAFQIRRFPEKYFSRSALFGSVDFPKSTFHEGGLFRPEPFPGRFKQRRRFQKSDFSRGRLFQQPTFHLCCAHQTAAPRREMAWAQALARSLRPAKSAAMVRPQKRGELRTEGHQNTTDHWHLRRPPAFFRASLFPKRFAFTKDDFSRKRLFHESGAFKKATFPEDDPFSSLLFI